MNTYKKFQDFSVYILLGIVLPFIPLLTEFLISGKLDRRNSIMFIIVTILGIGVSYKEWLVISFGIILSIVYSVMYGLITSNSNFKSSYFDDEFFKPYLLVLIIVIHLGLAINRRFFKNESLVLGEAE